MTISLYIAVDKSGRIYYTGDKSDVENFLHAVKNDNLQLVELKGVINV